MAPPAEEVMVQAPVEAVWDVLRDGWLYPLWVVGATHMRDVDDNWPAIGARLHHSVGVWPLQLADSTVVRSVQPGHHLELQARALPFGAALVRIDLRAADGTACRVRMAETVETGPGSFVPEVVQAPFVLPAHAGVYSYEDDFPTRTWNDSHYWVSPEFQAS